MPSEVKVKKWCHSDFLEIFSELHFSSLLRDFDINAKEITILQNPFNLYHNLKLEVINLQCKDMLKDKY